MSTYVTRVVEVKLPCIQGYVCQEKDLDKIDKKSLKPWDVYKINSDSEYPYRKWHVAHDIDGIPEHWEKMKSCDYKWELLKYWVTNNIHGYKTEHPDYLSDKTELKKKTDFWNNGGSIRDVYLSQWYSDKYNIVDRGIPDDCSEETLKELELDDKYIYNRTNVLLSELCSIYSREIEEFKNKIKDNIFNKQLKTIDEKVDKIYSKLNGEDIPSDDSSTNKENNDNISLEDDEEEYDYEVNINTLFDEKFNDIQTLNDEITIIHHLVDETYGYISSENIRVNYYFS